MLSHAQSTCNLIRWRALLLLVSVVALMSNAAACIPAIESLGDTDQMPSQVLNRFCHPEAGYDSLLLIRAALDTDDPVFRIIAVRKDGSGSILNVRLYQFNRRGQGLPAVFGQPQAVIDFESKPPVYVAQVKGFRTSISFEGGTFTFDMGGFFNTRIREHLNPGGKIAIDTKPASILLISTSNRQNWRWLTDNGQRMSL